MNRTTKEATVAELRERFESAEAVIVTDYRGLTVAQANKLRRALDQEKAVYRVVKNNLARIAVEGTPFEILRDGFAGPTSITLSYGDPTATTKVLTEFARGNVAFVIRSGAIAGKLLSPEAVQALSKLPTRQELLGQFVGVIAGPLRSMLGVLSGVPRSLVQSLSAIQRQKTA